MSKILGMVCASAVAASAHAGVVFFQMDINAATMSAGGPFGGTTHTGALNVTQDANTVLAGIFVFNTPVVFTGNVQSFNGQITLAGGVVTGAFFDIVINDGSEFHAVVTPGSGGVTAQAGQGFNIDGLTFNARFENLVGGTHFAGVDMSAFANGIFNGSFLASSYSPNAGGTDDNTNFEFYAFVPTPGAAALLGVAGMAMGVRRRR